jgi:hypothetical protein
MWPEENVREHAELDAVIAERDSVCVPTELAMIGGHLDLMI